MRDLDLPRGGDNRELVVDRDRVYQLDGADSRTLAPTVSSASRRNTISTFRRSLENLHDQRLVDVAEHGVVRQTERGRRMVRPGSLPLAGATRQPRD